MKRILLSIGLPIVLLLWGQTACYTVDQAEYAYVTRFGERVATQDGASEAGLHFKAPWPVDAVLRVDRRLQSFDLPAVESLTRDPTNKTVDKTLAVDAFITWRVPDSDAAHRFVRTVGSPEQAKRVLAPWVSGRLAAVVSSLPLDALIAVTDEAGVDTRTERLRQQLLGEDGSAEKIRDKVLADYGIEIVDLRVRRITYPETVRESIAERIRSERARKVADYESEGRKRASDILSAAEKEARTIEANALATKRLVEGRAEVEADRIRNDAHSRDPDFYAFLQKLEAYKLLLSDTRDVLLLSTKHPLFDLLLTPPSPNEPVRDMK